jgi:TRAP-type C4-dicarboxylate transport system permease small subunit
MTLDRIVRFFALIAGGVLFALMLLTVYSVVMRYVFNAPPIFTLDLSRMLLIAVVAFGLAYCGWTGGHIAVDLIETVGWPKLARCTDIVVRLVCAGVIGLWAWKLAGLALDSYEVGNATNMVQIPHHPFVWMMVVGAGLYAAVLIALMMRSCRGQEDPPTS